MSNIKLSPPYRGRILLPAPFIDSWVSSGAWIEETSESPFPIFFLNLQLSYRFIFNEIYKFWNQDFRDEHRS